MLSQLTYKDLRCVQHVRGQTLVEVGVGLPQDVHLAEVARLEIRAGDELQFDLTWGPRSSGQVTVYIAHGHKNVRIYMTSNR